MRTPLLALSALLLLFGWGVLACSSPSTAAVAPRPVTVPPPGIGAEKPVDLPGLHNVVAYVDGLYSGSAPEGPGLETLANMGIRTIVSVDGAQPEAEAAEKLGLRYVHLPIGYDGMSEARKLELARALRDLPGPMYVHCHHGKHRSAGAAAAMAISLGRLTPEGAALRMKVSGTAPEYKGLWACASDTTVASEAALDGASNAFPTHFKTTGMVQAMVEIDYAIENLKEIEKASWTTPVSHPDLVPAAEVGRISHLLRELESDPETKRESAEFHELLRAGRATADALEQGLLARETPEELGKRMKALGQSCKDCHSRYRN